MRIQDLFKKIIIFSLIILVTACASYSDILNNISSLSKDGKCEEALKNLDKSAIAKSSSNLVLYHMTRGSILFDGNFFLKASEEWQKGIHKIESLYTMSATKQIAGFLIKDDIADYEGDIHEKLLLPIYSAIAYLGNQRAQDALIDIRKLVLMITYIENEGFQIPLRMRQFCAILSGIVFELNNEMDSAIIEYSKALLPANTSFISTDALYDLVIAPLYKIAEARNRKDVMKKCENFDPRVRQIFNKNIEAKSLGNKTRNSDILIIQESGKSPLKESENILFPIDGRLIRISYGVYKKKSMRSWRDDSILVDDIPIKTHLALDIETSAIEALQIRRTKDLARLAARVIAKDQAAQAAGRAFGPFAALGASILGAVTEQADTRSWSLLPGQIRLARVTRTKLMPKSSLNNILKNNNRSKNILIKMDKEYD